MKDLQARRRSYNLGIVVDWKESDWVSCLLAGLREGNFSPLLWNYSASPTSELDGLFVSAQEPTRGRMKKGVVQAIHEWDWDLHERSVLHDLSWLAAQWRASEAVGDLCRILLDNRQYLGDIDHPFFATADHLLSVLAGFPQERVVFVFEALLAGDDISPRLAGLLAVGICRSAPERFATVFERFYARRAREQTYFDDTRIIQAFKDAVTAAVISNEMHKLTFPAQEYIALAVPLAELIGTGDPKDSSRTVAPLSSPVKAAELDLRIRAGKRKIELELKEIELSTARPRRRSAKSSSGKNQHVRPNAEILPFTSRLLDALKNDSSKPTKLLRNM